MMGLAAYAFHWTPGEFWQATPHEFFAAYEIWSEAQAPAEGG